MIRFSIELSLRHKITYQNVQSAVFFHQVIPKSQNAGIVVNVQLVVVGVEAEFVELLDSLFSAAFIAWSQVDDAIKFGCQLCHDPVANAFVRPGYLITIEERDEH